MGICTTTPHGPQVPACALADRGNHPVQTIRRTLAFASSSSGSNRLNHAGIHAEKTFRTDDPVDRLLRVAPLSTSPVSAHRRRHEPPRFAETPPPQ